MIKETCDSDVSIVSMSVFANQELKHSSVFIFHASFDIILIHGYCT